MSASKNQTFPGLTLLTKKPIWLGYGLVVLIVIATVTATMLLPVISHRAVFLLLLCAIIQVAYFLGINFGILAILLSLVTVDTLILLPSQIPGQDMLLLNMVFCVAAGFMIITVSKQKQLTTSLLQSQRELDHAQAVGQIGSWRLDVQSGQLEWSVQNYRMFGVPKGTAMDYGHFLAMIHPDDRDYVDSMWQAALTGQNYDIEHRVVVDGKTKWFREKAVLEFDGKGVLIAGFGTTQDITIAKRAELALLESRLSLIGILESMLDAVVVIDRNQRITFHNAAAVSMFGLEDDTAIGRPITGFIRNPGTLGLGSEWQDARLGLHCSQHQKGDVCVLKGLRADGQEFPVEVSVSVNEFEDEELYTLILRDITERELVGIQLQERLTLQDQLAKVAAAVPGVIFSFRLRPDKTMSIPYASPAFKSVYGIDFDLVIASFAPIYGRIHPDDLNHIDSSIAESAATLQPWSDCFRYNHPSKGEIWIEGHSLPLLEKDGSILWHGYSQDVTDRINAEKQLQERIERYKLVLEGAQDAIWDWDIANKHVLYSTRWKTSRGYAEHEIGDDEQAWSAHIHPDDRDRVLAALNDHFEGKTAVFNEEYRTRCKDGSWKWILDRGLAKHNADGVIIRMAGSESDITARKLAESALRERENELQLIMDATPALISYLDCEFRYVRVNASYKKWFGVSDAEILGKCVQEVFNKKSWEMLRPYLERACAGEEVSFELQIPYQSISSRWVHATYVPNIDAAGKVNGIVVHVFDISEMKQAELKISSLNQRLRRRIQEMQVIFATVPFGLCIANDANSFNIQCNPAIGQLFGLPSGAELSKYPHPKPGYGLMQNGIELAAEEMPMQKAVCGEIVSNQVLDVLREDGKAMKVLVNASPLFDEVGKVRGAVGAFLDITALTQAEDSLKRSQLQLHLFIEQAPLSMAMFDRDMNYLVASRRWTEEFGCGFDDLAGLNHYRLHPDLPGRWLEIHRQAQAGEFLQNDEDLWIQADGTKVWLRWSAYPWLGPAGEIGGIIISCENITARYMAEAELRSKEAQLAFVVEQVKAGYWVYDLDSNSLFMSPELKRQIGSDESEVLNNWDSWLKHLHPDDKLKVTAATNAFMSGEQSSYELEFRVREAGGSYRWLHSRGVLLHDGMNKSQRMLGISLDTTDYVRQKELASRRLQMEQDFRLNVAVQTAAAIAHELNQPLAAIASYSDVALYLLQTGNPDPQKLFLAVKNCTVQAQRAGLSIRQLLALLHKDESVSELIDINALIKESVDYVKAEGWPDGFTIQLDLAVDLPLVQANSLQIQKVIVNLLHNGLDSMQGLKNADLVTVKSCLIHKPETSIQISISDTGKGVDSKTLLKGMFKPFYTTKSTGLGMGLAVSKSMVEAHQGKMWAEQNPGQGLTINFTLPC